MNGSEHPAAAYGAEVAKASKRATGAMVALGITTLVRVYNLPVRMWQSGLLHDVQAGNSPGQATLELSDTLVGFGALAQFAVLVLTATLFLRWLHLTVRLTRSLGGDTLRFTPKEAVWGFIIPFVNFQKPYQIVRDVHDHLAPDMVPDAQVIVRADASMGYREVAMEAPPAPVKIPHAAIGAWWGAFWIGNIIANIAARQTGSTIDALLTSNALNSLADAVEMVSAILAVLMVRGLNARRQERYRRVRHNTPETLQAAGVVIQ